MQLYINGIGLLGPGLVGWRESRAVLAGERSYEGTAPPEPAASILPPNELRRSSDIVRWAVHVAQEAIEQAQINPREVATVFASSGGETGVLDRLCTALATPQRVVSPTLFHQSVHNTAAGYWGIATSCQQSSTALSCYDSSFCGGMLDAAVYVCAEEKPVLMVACDLPPPPPLYDARPLNAGFAVGLVLTHDPSRESLAQCDLNMSNDSSEAVTVMDDTALETLRMGNPAARSLSLLSALARAQRTLVRMDYLEDQRLLIGVMPCQS